MNKMRKVLEKDIQRSICDWLFTEGYFFWRQNTVPVFHKGEFRALPKYTPRGLPDIMIISFGKFIGLEVKRPGERGGNPKSVEAQEIMAQKIISNGGFYKVVHSLQEAQDYLSMKMPIV